MLFEKLFSIEAVLQLLVIYVFGKFLLWLGDYIYRVWVYSHAPGDPIIPFIGNALQLLGHKSEFIKSIIKLQRKYNNAPFVRVWIGTKTIISFSKPDNLGTLFNSFNDKADTYKLLYPWLRTGLLTSGGEKWIKRRKMLTQSFHFDILKDFFLVMSEHAEIFVENLMKIDKTKYISLQNHIAAFTIDVISETAMGYNLNAQAGQNDVYVKTVCLMCENLVKRQQRPWLTSDFIFNLSDYGKKQKNYLKILLGFTKKIIHERAENFQGLSKEFGNLSGKKRIAFLDLLLDARQQDPNSINLDDIQEEVDTFMFEGHDTTTSAINWSLFTIATHPLVQKKLSEEIEEVLKNSSNITIDDLNKLNYLECVIKETLRLFPPVPIIGRKISEDIIIDGYKLLKDSEAFLVIYELHRDERFFPESEKFKPERFLNENTERNPFVYVPFSFGKRNCIGQRFAMMEIKIILTKLLRNFEFECNQTVDDVLPCGELILRPQNDILFKIKPKKKI